MARLAGCPTLNLDDFYYDADHPGLPASHGRIDWDDPATWDAAAAAAAIETLLRTGAAEVPRYDISRSAAVGTHTITVGDLNCFIAEGIFAVEAAEQCASAGITVERLYLDRPRVLVTILRFVRDVREQRKSLPVLIRRGVALFRSQPELRARAVAAGFRPVGLKQAVDIITA